MTREEQIIKASQLYAKHQQKPFMDGAMWADANPNLYSVTRKAVEKEREYLINKIAGWLQENIDHYAYNKDFISLEEFIENFKKSIKRLLTRPMNG